MVEKGFIKLSRKFFENDIWRAARIFNESEAWLDLIQSARFEASETTSHVGGRDITWGRGQYPASNRFLAKKWKWGEQKVKSFLSRLKKEGMVTTCANQGMNVITLCNYDIYNDNNSGNSPEHNSLDNTTTYHNINDLQGVVTQPITRSVTHDTTNGSNLQPGDNPNTKKEEEYNILYPRTCEEEFLSNVLDKDLNSCYEELMGNQTWMETFVMNYRSSGNTDFTPEKFYLYLNEFFKELMNRGETRKSPKEAMSHFSNWIKKTRKEEYDGGREKVIRRPSKVTTGDIRGKVEKATDIQPDGNSQKNYSKRF